jgi:hypothetical protein
VALDLEARMLGRLEALEEGVELKKAKREMPSKQ